MISIFCFIYVFRNYLRHYNPGDSPHAKREWSCIYLIISKNNCFSNQTVISDMWIYFNTGNILSCHLNIIKQSNEFEFVFCYCYYYPIKCIRLHNVVKDSNNGALLLKHCYWKIITSTPTSARMGLASFHLCRSCMRQAQLIDHFEITKVKKEKKKKHGRAGFVLLFKEPARRMIGLQGSILSMFLKQRPA